MQPATLVAQTLDLERLHASLNPEQREAAMVVDGPVLVVAGAGAGKTKTLIHRVATLLGRGIAPANILCVTFTSKAAQEIRDRLEGMVGEAGQHVVAGTFHSVVFRHILKRFPDSEFLKAQGINLAELAILDDGEAKALMKEAVDDLPLEWKSLFDEDVIELSDIDREMTMARAHGKGPDEYLSSITVGDTQEQIKRLTGLLWKAYTARCRQMNGVDFDDILLLAAGMLKAEPQYAKELSEMFRYIMLDEYQDTNVVQMAIMDAIAQHHQNIFVVGDAKQSIYRFRGAEIGVILGFDRRYPNRKIVELHSNYRSSAEIIPVANACAEAMAEKQGDGQLVAEQGACGQKVYTFSFATAEQEADFIRQAIQDDLRAGVPANEISVLYRNRSLKIALENALISADVPYTVIGDTAFYQRAEVRDVVALLRYLTRPWDSMAAIRVIKATRIGVSDASVKQAMKDERITAHEYLRQQAGRRLRAKTKGQNQPDLSAAAKKLAPLLDFAEGFRKAVEDAVNPEILITMMANIWDVYFRPRLERAADADADEAAMGAEFKRANVLQVFRRVADDMLAGRTLSDVIDDLAMMTDASRLTERERRERVQIMTMHASKGLEYDHVYIIGVDRQTLPGEGVAGPDGMIDLHGPEAEEARRLLYVGITRAKKKLRMSFARYRDAFGKPLMCEASPFTHEILQNRRSGLLSMEVNDGVKPRSRYKAANEYERTG